MFTHEEFLENKEAKVVIKDTDMDSVRSVFLALFFEVEFFTLQEFESFAC